MAALPSHQYRDPLDVLIADESRTCKGCKWLVEYIVFGEKKQICEKLRKKRNAKCYEEKPGKIYCQVGRRVEKCSMYRESQ